MKYAQNRIVWFTEDPYEHKTNLKNENLFDLVLSTDHQSSENYLTQSKYFPLAAPESLFKNDRSTEKKYDIFLFGSLWPNRIDLLEKIVSNLENTQFRILLLTSQNDQEWVSQERIFKIFFEIEKHKGRVIFISRPFSLTKIKELAQISKVCINWPRLFEKDEWSVPGPDILHLVPANSFINYNTSNVNEVLTTVINDNKKMTQVGNEMFEYVLANHTWRTRVSELFEMIDKKLAK